MTVPVWWLNLYEGICRPRETWDCQLLQAAMDGTLWPSVELPTFVHHEGPERPEGMTGGLVVLNGGFHWMDVDRVNRALDGMEWIVLLLTSDEQSAFPHEKLVLPQRNKLWVMTPRPDRTYPPHTRFVGEGWPPETPEKLTAIGNRERTVDVTFAGQLGHSRRDECWSALEKLEADTDLNIVGAKTQGFAQGYDRDDYLAMLAESKIVLCPSGPRTPDSFRYAEALEAGCVPILDQTAPNYPARGYFPMVLPGCPAPLIGEWSDLEKFCVAILDDWHRISAQCQSYWQGHKRWMVTQLADDLKEVGGLEC